MGIFQSFRNLTPRARITVGAAFLAWGTIGLYVTEGAEKNLGFEATQQDKEALEAAVPRILVVDRERKG